MGSLFDRYLLNRFVQAFVVIFASLLGLYVVLDVFTNIDEFTHGNRPILAMIGDMFRYYGFRTFAFFDTVGSLVTILACMMSLSLLWRHGELNPVLSAGIPTYRLAVPLIGGTLVSSLLLAANQEWLLPKIANQLQLRPGQNQESYDRLKPEYDFATNILIANGKIFPQSRKLGQVEFILPMPEIVSTLTTLHAEEATFHTKSATQPAGWLLSQVEEKYALLRLTDSGKSVVHPGPKPDSLFIASEISFDQLVNRHKFFENLSTRELLDRARNPSFSVTSLRSQSLHLHTRLTRPLLNVLIVLMIVPLVIRKESRFLVTNLAMGLAAMVTVLGIQQASQFLSLAGLIRLDLGAWIPVFCSGVFASWFSGVVRT